jgi:phosphatidylserine/phosphatidylglycerophosphate/cardiolipin synthase-like enzyme
MCGNYNNYDQKRDYNNLNYYRRIYSNDFKRNESNKIPDRNLFSNYQENKYKYEQKSEEFKKMNFQNKKLDLPQENKAEKDLDNNRVQFFSPNDNNNIDDIIKKLESAKDSIDIAMYTLTNAQLIKTILKCFDNKVRVRILLDYNMTQKYSSFLIELIMNGIYIKTNDNPEESMHHKFVIIDNKFVLNGSLNWSEKGVIKNYENIIILDDEKIVQQFTTQFDELWLKFGDIITLLDIEQNGKFYNNENDILKYSYSKYNQKYNCFDILYILIGVVYTFFRKLGI